MSVSIFTTGSDSLDIGGEAGVFRISSHENITFAGDFFDDSSGDTFITFDANDANSFYNAIGTATGRASSDVRSWIAGSGIFVDPDGPVTLGNLNSSNIASAIGTGEQDVGFILNSAGFYPEQLLAPTVNPGWGSIEVALRGVATGTLAAVAGLATLTSAVLAGLATPQWAGGNDEIRYEQYQGDIQTSAAVGHRAISGARPVIAMLWIATHFA